MNTICLSTSQSQCLIGSYWINLLFLEFPCTGRGSASLFSHLVSLEIAAFLLQCEIACTDDPCSSFSPHCVQYTSISLRILVLLGPGLTETETLDKPSTTRQRKMLLTLLLFAYKQQFHKELEIVASEELAKIENSVVVHGFGFFMKN